MTPEIQIEDRIFTFLNVIGAFAWKNRSIGVYDKKKGVFRKSNKPNHINGTSDIFLLFMGRFIAIEVKTQRGVVTPEQRKFIARVNNEGHIAFVARSVWQVAEELGKHFPDHAARFKKIARQLEYHSEREH